MGNNQSLLNGAEAISAAVMLVSLLVLATARRPKPTAASAGA